MNITEKYDVIHWDQSMPLKEEEVIEGISNINKGIPVGGASTETWSSEYDKHIQSGINNEVTSLYLAMTSSQQIIGYATVTKQEDCSRLRLIALKPEHRRKGVFLQIINRIFEDKVNVLTLSLRSSDSDDSKRAFNAYDKLNRYEFSVQGLHPTKEEEHDLPHFKNGDLRLQLEIRKI